MFFEILFCSVWALQVCKEWHVGPAYITTLLVVGIVRCLRGDRKSLALIGLIYLALRGSSSNHVVLLGIVCIAVLEGGGSRALLAALYFVTGIAKLNSGWFDDDSCATLYASQFGRFPLAPWAAVLGEFGLSYAFWVGPTRGVMCMAFLFHVPLAIVKPPMSVYPFSMLVAPMIALDDHGDFPWIVTTVFPVVLAALPEIDALEYPPYFSWRLGVAWCVTAFSALVIRVPQATERKWRIAPLLLLMVGTLPYVGVRVHPAFAMFSNLRVEANSNHWIFTDSVLRRIDLGHGMMSDFVTVLDADLTSVTNLRVDLGAWITHPVGEFIISPPAKAWPPRHLPPPARPLEFKPFSVPYVELRRRVTQSDGAPFFVDYERAGHTHRIQCFQNGTIHGDLDLLVPLPTLTALIFRFRAFDLDRSPCRH